MIKTPPRVRVDYQPNTVGMPGVQPFIATESTPLGFRFRNTIKIAPGIRLNIGKTGVSLSAGRRGATVTIGKRGIYGNLGIPGTGLSYRTRLDQSPSHQRRVEQQGKHQNGEKDYADTLIATFSLDDKGNLLMTDAQGKMLSAAERRLMWEQNEAGIQQWLDDQLERINSDGELLLSIHEDTPAPSSSPPTYELEEYAGQQPIAPVIHLPPKAPEAPAAPAQRPWHRHSRRLRRRQEKSHQRALTEWREDLARADAAQINTEQQITDISKAHQQRVLAWHEKADAFRGNEQQLENLFSEGLQHNEPFMAEVLETELAQLDWPRETLVDFRIDVDDHSVQLDVDLPEIQDIPTRSAKHSANQQRLLIKNKGQKQLRLDYARHIHGVCLRLTGVVFATLPTINSVTLSAYSQRVDSATGHSEDDYLLSVHIIRDAFARLNFAQLAQLDPIAALDQLDLRRNMTKAGLIRAIEPFAEPDAANP